MIDVAKELKVAMQTGKVVLGSKQAMRLASKGKAKLIIMASNTPQGIKDKISAYARVSKIPIYIYPGSSWDLGAICGKPFVVAAVSVIDEGDSEILKLAGEGG